MLSNTEVSDYPEVTVEPLSKREEIQQEALNAVFPYRKAGLHISMGVGKTYIGLQYISKFLSLDKEDSKVLVVAPKVSIYESWKTDAVKFNLSHLKDRIVFTTYLSLNNHNPLDYDILVLDEAHNTKLSHDFFLSLFNGRILGLTGTPPKYKYGEKGTMMLDYYPIKYSYTVNDAVEEEILNDYRIYVHTMPLGTANNFLTGKAPKTFYTSEAKNYSWITNEIERASLKQVFIKKIMQINFLKQYTTKIDFVGHILAKVPADEKCIVFANTTEQADSICTYSHHSKNGKKLNEENLELFASGAITRLSAVEQLSEGINIPNLKHIVIMHSYGNEKKASQKIGRALRLNKDEVANIHVLCYDNTIDRTWVAKALEEFDRTKIKWINWDYKQKQFVRL